MMEWENRVRSLLTFDTLMLPLVLLLLLLFTRNQLNCVHTQTWSACKLLNYKIWRYRINNSIWCAHCLFAHKWIFQAQYHTLIARVRLQLIASVCRYSGCAHFFFLILVSFKSIYSRHFFFSQNEQQQQQNHQRVSRFKRDYKCLMHLNNTN